MAVFWKELVVASGVLPSDGWQEFTLQPSSAQGSTSTTQIGGGVPFRDSGSTNPVTRNRFLVWRAVDGCLELVDLSLDASLHSNGVRIRFDSCKHLPGGISIRETRDGLNLLVTTSSQVHRFVLPAPGEVEPSSMSPDSVYAASVLASFHDPSVKPDYSTVTVQLSVNSMEPHAASTWSSPNGDAWFALASLDGTIRIVFLPTDSTDRAVQFELKMTSMMQRLWNGLVPLTMRGSAVSVNAVSSVCLQEIGGALYALAVCRDLKLRIWSVETRECVESTDLTLFIPDSKTVQPSTDHDHVLFSVPRHGSEAVHLFAVYLSFIDCAQISVVSVNKSASSSHLLVQLESNSLLQPEDLGRLVDLTCSGSSLFGLWLTKNGVKLRHHSFKSSQGWVNIDWDDTTKGGFEVISTDEPREAYLDHMLKTVKFSRNVIVKALQLFMRMDGRNLMDVSLEELRSQISAAVESQVQTEASSFEIQHDEYRQLQIMCWSRFYEGCKQYAKMDNEPIGLFEDLETGLLCVVKRASVSFIRPCEPLESIFTYQLTSNDDQSIFGDEALGNDVSRLVMCACAVNEQMAQQQLCVDLSQVIGEVRQQIEHIADTILSHSRLQSLASESLIQRLQTITSLPRALSLLIERLDGNQQPLDGSYDDDDEDGGERHPVCSQLFSSYLGISVLSRAFTQIVDVRLWLCVSLAVVTQMAITLRQKVGLSLSVVSQLTAEVLPQLLTFSCVYHSLHWISEQGCVQTSTNAVEANLRHLAALNLSDMIPSGILQSEQPLSLLKLFLSEVGGTLLRLTLIQSAPLSPSLLTEKRPYWTAGLSVAVSTLLHLLWPDKQELVFGEFLMAQCQYTPLQLYLDLLSPLSLNCSGTVCFLRGQSFLHCGELAKAHYWFMKAAHSLDEPCLLKMASDDGSEITMIEYYAKLMQIYEQVSASDLIVRVTAAALLTASPDDENTPIFWSGRFKHLLELNNLEGAYTAMISNPDPVRRKDCLRRFIVVLCERGRVKELCSFPYVGLQDEVMSLIELRARSSDLSTGVFYDLLYSFHVTRRSFRRAAFAMYEYATRLARELNDLQSLQKQGKCYLAAMNALHVVEKKSAWIVRPAEWDVGTFTQKEMAQRHHHRRRAHGQGRSAKPSLHVIEVNELQREYSLVLARLKLLQYSPDITIGSKHRLPAEETLTLLIQAGLFDTAMDIATTFKLQYDTIFVSLTSRCVKLSSNPQAERQDWEWLSWNDSIKNTMTKEMSVVEQAWQMLQLYQKQVLSLGIEVIHTFHRCVSSQLLSLGSVMPQWLIASYLQHFPSELLQLYLQFDLLNEAGMVALRYVNAVLGKGKEYFGLKNAVHVNQPAVWLPYTVLEQLAAALERVPTGSTEVGLGAKLRTHLSEYQNCLESISHEMITHGSKKAERLKAGGFVSKW